jgi:hypothetical protein
MPSRCLNDFAAVRRLAASEYIWDLDFVIRQTAEDTRFWRRRAGRSSVRAIVVRVKSVSPLVGYQLRRYCFLSFLLLHSWPSTAVVPGVQVGKRERSR